MSEVKLSIVIPFHNVREYIETSLKTVVNQTLKDIEIICINDASDDGSEEIVQRFAQNDGRFRIINLETRQGQGFARNIGIENATGKYIGFVDADDWVKKTMFEKLFNKAEKYNSDISMCKTILFDEKIQKEDFTAYYQLDALRDFFDKNFNAYEIRENILNFNVAIWNKIYRTDFLKNANIRFPEGYIYEDLPFFFETLLKSNSMSIVNEDLYYYRINRPGSTMQDIGDKICNRIDMLETTFYHIKDCPFYSEIETDVLNWIVEDISHRASLIDVEFFEQYFNKAKAFLEKIGFTSKDILKGKGIVFLEEVIFWLSLSTEQALFFQKSIRTTVKKLDKVYETINSNYKYINFKADEICQNFKPVYDKINDIKFEAGWWHEHIKKEFEQVYDNMTAQSNSFEDSMNKLLVIQKDEISKEIDAKKSELESCFKTSLFNLEEKMNEKLTQTVQKMQAEFEQEKNIREEEFDKKINEQRVKYERKLIQLEDDYNLLYKKLKPVIKILNFLRLIKKGVKGERNS